jgi:phosphoglycolate phosphatase-like HAD superfamily hydrolase
MDVTDRSQAHLRRIDRRSLLAALATSLAAAHLAWNAAAQAQTANDPLPSWNERPAKAAILEFVRSATDPSSQTLVPPEDRIATFDQDGTLWVEHPVYAQAMFALDRVHALAPQHPEWQSAEPFKSVLVNNMEAIGKFSEREWAEIVFLTHSGMSQEEFREIVGQWMATARHPRFKRPYTELVYQPMLEVMDHLRANGFKTYIVTGGGQDFVRAYAQKVYRVPPEQVIGSSLATTLEDRNGKPEVMRLPELFLDDDHAGKVIGIDLFIGKRPYAAFGNSTGDREMLEWTGAGPAPRLKVLIRHDDWQREYAYGPGGGLPDTKVGTFDQALLDEAAARSWTVVSMKNDWKRVFALE